MKWLVFSLVLFVLSYAMDAPSSNPCSVIVDYIQAHKKGATTGNYLKLALQRDPLGMQQCPNFVELLKLLNLPTLQILCDAGVDVGRRFGEFSILHNAIEHKRLDIAKYLLSQTGLSFDFNQRIDRIALSSSYIRLKRHFGKMFYSKLSLLQASIIIRNWELFLGLLWAGHPVCCDISMVGPQWEFIQILAMWHLKPAFMAIYKLFSSLGMLDIFRGMIWPTYVTLNAASQRRYLILDTQYPSCTNMHVC